MSYATIITAIDTAIESWVGEPQSLSINGRTITYRSLDELVRTRAHYSALLRTTGGGTAFQLHHFKAGAP